MMTSLPRNAAAAPGFSSTVAAETDGTDLRIDRIVDRESFVHRPGDVRQQGGERRQRIRLCVPRAYGSRHDRVLIIVRCRDGAELRRALLKSRRGRRTPLVARPRCCRARAPEGRRGRNAGWLRPTADRPLIVGRPTKSKSKKMRFAPAAVRRIDEIGVVPARPRPPADLPQRWSSIFTNDDVAAGLVPVEAVAARAQHVLGDLPQPEQRRTPARPLQSTAAAARAWLRA